MCTPSANQYSCPIDRSVALLRADLPRLPALHVQSPHPLVDPVPRPFVAVGQDLWQRGRGVHVPHVAPILVDHLHLTAGNLDARDLAQRLEVEELAEPRVRERDTRPFLRLVLHQHHADVLAVGGGIGPPADQHWRGLAPDLALLQRLQVQLLDRPLPAIVQRVVGRAHAAAGPVGPLKVRHLRDHPRVQVVSEQVALVLPVGCEHKRAVVTKPTQIGVVVDAISKDLWPSPLESRSASSLRNIRAINQISSLTSARF
jgi:hypothetical protein